MLTAFLRAFRTPDLRRKLLFTICMIAVFRLGAALPTPGISESAVHQCIGLASTPAVEPWAAAFEQNATFFSLMPGVGSEAPKRNNAMRPRVISSFLRRSGVWNARTKAVSMRSPRFG